MPSVEKRGNGETPYRVRWINADGERDSAIGFETYDLAYNHGLDQETDVRRGVYIDPRQGDVTVREFASEWIDSLEVGHLSLRDYRSRLRAHILPRWGDVELGAITGMAVRTWRKKLLAVPLSEGRVNDILMVLRIMLDDAVADRLILANPIPRKSRRGKYTETAKPERTWAAGRNVVAIAENARAAHGLTGYATVMTLAYTGMRMQEMAALRRENVHLTARRHEQWIDVRKQAQYVDGVYQLVDCKYASARAIVIPPSLADLLGQVLASHDSEWVFLQAKGEQVKPGGHWYSTYWDVWVNGRAETKSSRGHKARAAIAAVPGMEDLDPHGLRHGHQVVLDEDFEHGHVAVEKRMGHKIKGIARVYAHVSDEMTRKISTRLDEHWQRSLAPAAAAEPAPLAAVRA